MPISRDRLYYEKGYVMSHQGNEPAKNELWVEFRPVEIVTATAELQKRLTETQDAVRHLEEAKNVSQETMKLEVSI